MTVLSSPFALRGCTSSTKEDALDQGTPETSTKNTKKISGVSTGFHETLGPNLCDRGNMSANTCSRLVGQRTEDMCHLRALGTFVAASQL